VTATRQRTVAKTRLDVRALWLALDDERRRRDVAIRDRSGDLILPQDAYTWKRVAREAGVSQSTLTRLGKGLRPDADGLVRLLLWLHTTDVGPYIEGAE
jgi:hypothetical protein